MEKTIKETEGAVKAPEELVEAAKVEEKTEPAKPAEPATSTEPVKVSKLLPLPEKRMPEIEDLLKSGVHFGHQTGRWDPRARVYIYGERNGVHIINLQATLKQLALVLDKIQEIIKNNGKILFVGTKRQVRSLVLEAAEITGMPYVTERWLGGTFTNFTTLNRRVQKLLEIENRFKEGKLAHYTKKEQSIFKKQLADFNRNMGGIKTLNELPQAIIVVGVKEEKTAIAEAKKTGVSIIGLADTNINPATIDYPIPANDDAVKSVQLMLRHLVKEIQDSKQK
jgi:small subunit ribosomal protein S2